MMTDSVLLWSALVLGFVGSMHCVGMCGPIALALPITSSTRSGFIISRLLYNMARVITYSLLGLGIGLIGGMIRIAGLQEWLSIITGVGIITTTVFPRIISHYFPHSSIISRPALYLKSLFSQFLQSRTYSALFILGLLNGLLPCGFVYVALAGALNTQNSFQSTVFMALFGLGTVPAMLAVSLLPQFAKPNLRMLIRKITPVIAVVMGMVFIVRGLGLDIPYISPKLQVEKPAQSDCCRPHTH